MGTFAVYTFVAGVVLFASYIIYKWLLSTENQPAFNRAVLLSIYVVSFAAWPVLCAWSTTTAVPVGIEIDGAAATILAAPEASLFPWATVLLWIYMVGMCVTALWTIAVAVRLRRLIASGEKIYGHGYTLVLIDRDGIAPFSWGRYVVMNRNEDKETAAMILSHERAHIACLHFADLLLAQAACIVLWYNPASWLMLSELKSVHEYQADSHVLASGINAREYQLLLIKKAVGVRFPSLANSLNHSNLKKRITMMYNQKTSAVRRSRALAIVPAVALALALVNVPSVSRAIDRTASAELILRSNATMDNGKVNENRAINQERREPGVFAVETVEEKAGEASPDVMPKYPGGEAAMYKFLADNIKYPEAAVNDSIQGRVAVKFTIQPDGTVTDISVMKSVCPAIDAEAVRVTKLMPRWIPGEKDGKKVACQFTLPMSFKLQ